MYISSANGAWCNEHEPSCTIISENNRPRLSFCDRVFAWTCFESDLYTDLCALPPVLTEHSASNGENFVLNLEGSLHYYGSEAL